MVKETITYEDFDGITRTEEMYFNMTELELAELGMELPDDLMKEVNDNATVAEIMGVVIEKLGKKGVIDFIKRLILKAYGVRGEDGRSFKKTEKLSNEFSNSMAFHAFVMQLLSNDEASNKFFNGVVPSKMAAQIPTEVPGIIN